MELQDRVVSGRVNVTSKRSKPDRSIRLNFTSCFTSGLDIMKEIPHPILAQLLTVYDDSNFQKEDFQKQATSRLC